MAKAFRDWNFEEVGDTFGITQRFDSPLLTSWLEAEHEAPEKDRIVLEELRKELRYTIDTLNEEELKVYFIGPLLRLIPFRQEGRRPFLDRFMSFIYGDNQEAHGRIDWMLAEGMKNPKQPYFFLHEYKREIDATGDPLGQLLISMVGSRIKNEKDFPIYGCYVLGRHWFFVVLEGDQYAVSDSYSSTQDDIFTIYSILVEVMIRVKEHAKIS